MSFKLLSPEFTAALDLSRGMRYDYGQCAVFTVSSCC